MTAYPDARSAVGGDPDQLAAMADALSAGADNSDALATSLGRTAEATDTTWSGPTGTAYRTSTATRVSALAKLPKPLSDAAGAYRALSGELAAAQRKAATAEGESVQLGMGVGDLVGRPWQVADFVVRNPQHTLTVGRLIGDVVQARWMANAARDEFTTKMTAVHQNVAAAGGDRRDPDGVGGQRQRNDGLWRRPEGGDSRVIDGDRGIDLSSDWEGRAILGRYLEGGGNWTITDDADWSKYMMDNQILRNQLTGPSNEQAQQALRDYLAGKGDTGSFDRTFHAEIQNGEGIVGYEYLHGTDKSKGDFRYQGDTTVIPLPNGTYQVTTKGGYTWNDTIDPNPQYSTDNWKSRLAEILTLGRADPYDIHITWHAETTTILDKDGNVISAHGYPAS